MAREVICQFCKSQTRKVDINEVVKIDNKNFHKECAKLYEDRKKLYETVCRIFKLKAPGPKNNAYISKFFNQGMTYKGMYCTLIYFYDIRKNNIKKSNEGIGIIPYVYEEAKKYFEDKKNREKKEKEQLEKINEVVNREQEVRYVRAQKREKPRYKFHNENEFKW